MLTKLSRMRAFSLLVVLCVIFGCKTSKEIGADKRVFLDFQNNKVVKDKSVVPLVEMESPVLRKAGKDIAIEIYNYNPLKYQVSVENTSSDYFLGDTGKFSAFIVIPNITPLAAGDAKKEETLKANPNTTEAMLTVDGANSIPALSRPTTSCDSIKAYMASLNLSKINLENDILNYKKFINQVELIKGDYQFLKEQDFISSQFITDRLAQNFVSSLNNYLNSSGRSALNSNPSLISISQISAEEIVVYNKVMSHLKNIENLEEKVNKIQGTVGCAGFLGYYRDFKSKSEEIKNTIKEFEKNHVDKISPSFKQTLNLYDKLKSYVTNMPTLTTRLTIEKDLHTVTVYKTPLTSENKKEEYTTIKIEPVKGWKVDFAGGFFLTGVTDHKFSKITKDSIYTKKYLVNGVTRDTTVEEKFTSFNKENQMPISFGGMLLLHAHTQRSRLVNYGTYIGFGALFNDQTRWAGAVGGSVLIGKKQRFSINPGILISQVDRLSSPYEDGMWYKGVIDNTPTYKSWRLNWVIAFSWNIK